MTDSSNSTTTITKLAESSEVGFLSRVDFEDRICNPHEPGLENIILNPVENDTLSHIEIDPKTVRIEFKDVNDALYRQFVGVFLRKQTSNDGDGREIEAKLRGNVSGSSITDQMGSLNDDSELHPSVLRLAHAIKDVRNNTFCGAGATVYVTSLSLFVMSAIRYAGKGSTLSQFHDGVFY